VYRGIAHVHADGVYPVLAVDGQQRIGGGVEGLIPADFLPVVATVGARDASHGVAEAVRILVNVLERDGLGADMAAAQGVVRIALDGDDLLAARFDLQATDRLAEVAGAIVCFQHVGAPRCHCCRHADS
jgi:hypothetical protein